MRTLGDQVRGELREELHQLRARVAVVERALLDLEDAPSVDAPLPQRVLHALRAADRPLTSLEVVSAIQWEGDARPVHLSLYRLRRSGRVLADGRRPHTRFSPAEPTR